MKRILFWVVMVSIPKFEDILTPTSQEKQPKMVRQRFNGVVHGPIEVRLREEEEKEEGLEVVPFFQSVQTSFVSFRPSYRPYSYTEV